VLVVSVSQKGAHLPLSAVASEPKLRAVGACCSYGRTDLRAAARERNANRRIGSGYNLAVFVGHHLVAGACGVEFGRAGSVRAALSFWRRAPGTDSRATRLLAKPAPRRRCAGPAPAPAHSVSAQALACARRGWRAAAAVVLGQEDAPVLGGGWMCPF
jgi:hypothetical protein